MEVMANSPIWLSKEIVSKYTESLEAPRYDEYVPKPTFYFSPVCRKAKQSQHKSKCRELSRLQDS